MENPEAVVEEATPSETTIVNKPDPNTVMLITGSVIHFCEQNPDENEDQVLFLTVSNIVGKLGTFKQIDVLANAVFAYYLEAYRILDIAKQKDIEDDSALHADYKLTLYTKAALSLFDIYIAMPEQTLIRRLIPLAAAALYQVVTAHQSTVEDSPIEEVISDLSDLTILTQTVKDYVKGKKRVKNYPYIRVLKVILEQATSSHDLSFIRNRSEIKDIVSQVKSSKRIITIT